MLLANTSGAANGESPSMGISLSMETSGVCTTLKSALFQSSREEPIGRRSGRKQSAWLVRKIVASERRNLRKIVD